ncbi:hypothetical protein PENTCL1PPCAC_633, partial [Pristionchus entomophagus]
IERLEMAEQYENDWEDPRLAAKSFVSDYIVWRLAKDGLEWCEASDVPEEAYPEHIAMRRMCAIFEDRNVKELITLGEVLNLGSLNYTKYCKVVNQFGETKAGVPSDMTYGRMVGLVAFAGLLCVEKVKGCNMRGVELIALYTSNYIDKRIRSTWKDAMRSWAQFMEMTSHVSARHSRLSLQPPLYRSARSARPRRSSILVVTAASIVGACVVGRMFKGH